MFPPRSRPTPSSKRSKPGIKVVVCITEGIPTRNMIEVFWEARASRVVLIGPNCPGVITPASARSASCPATSTGRDESA